MIVPRYWAEGVARERRKGRQVTVRRFGWSDASQEAAQAHAEARTREALQRLLAGEALSRREPKLPYNGAEGVPIREEILSQHGDTIITRNAYGAHCLNTPNVLFADIDHPAGLSAAWGVGVFLVLALCGVGLGLVTRSLMLGVVLIFAGALLTATVGGPVQRLVLAARGGSEAVGRRRIARYLARHPGWNVRVYRTPAGLRVLATHRTFDPVEEEVIDCFRALGTDPIYVRMCKNQRCFRARLTAKPWRIGIQDHLKPRPGVWPVAPERLPARQAWVGRYDAAAKHFAACQFLESMGSGSVHPNVQAVVALHDSLCAARPGQAIA